VTRVPWPEDVEAVFARLARRRGCTWLDSAGGPQHLARWSVLAVEPAAVLVHQADTTRLLAPDGAVRMAVDADPFAALRRALAAAPAAGEPAPEGCPFGPGLYGYLAYDLGRYVEPTAGAARVRDIPLPDLYFGVYETVLVLDAARQEAHLVGRADGPAAEALRQAIEESDEASPALDASRVQADALHCTIDRDAYLRAVERGREYIAAGDIFQVNLSRRFTCALEGGEAAAARLASLYRRLRRANPAPYAAYLGLGQGRAVLSSSPELFLDLRSGRVVTRPIKGTRPRCAERSTGERGGSPCPPRAAADLSAAGTETRRAIDAEAFNRRQQADLLASEKDRAELVMIVDLERNDLGRVCAYGTVRVPEPRTVEAYAAVFHTVATVEGRLHAGRDVVDLVRATFPGGSITGAPKVRAMQIIAELEPTRRSVYTGAVGYLGPPTPAEPAGRCVLNIAIRTLLAAGPHVHLQVGGGIVADSDPEAEFDETADKARAMMAALLDIERHPWRQPTR